MKRAERAERAEYNASQISDYQNHPQRVKLSQKKVEMVTKVAEWEQSSMSIVAFARTYGITERKFYYWVQKVREATIASDNKPEFIEIGQSLLAGRAIRFI